ncbi:hypothetical protein RB2150_16487 [Rhodobacterales bacterium HTCC2150]|nr:hypothetical protein RB2150_16487 [Rhodobacterales bacterium HTCC2150] [Rhodobacteraceae bacterium HTCC2150]
MKPNFALDLSHEGISLYRRGRKEWLLVGLVALDDPEMDSALAVLRGTATGLDKAGLSTQLIIPSSQLLTREIYAPKPDREGYIVAALDGQTPYDVNDLVYDYSGAGDHIDAIIVAQETLDEAEAFAVEHGFNPVCFVASANGTPFNREPFFGETKFAADFLHGEPVDPHGEILPFRNDKPAVPEVPVIEETAPVDDDPSIDLETSELVQEDENDPAGLDTLSPDLPIIDDAEDSDEAELSAAPISFSSNRTSESVAAVGGDEPANKTLEQIAPRFGLSATPFEPDNAPKIQALPDETRIEPRLNLRPTTGDIESPAAKIDVPPAVPAPIPEPIRTVAPPSIPARDTNFAPVDTKKTTKSSIFSGLGAKISAALGGMIPAQKLAGIRKPTKKVKTSAPSQIPAQTNEAEALTVFGARKEQRGDNSKLGFILTIILLIFLLLIAFGSSYFLSDTIARLWNNDSLIQETEIAEELNSSEIEAAADAAALEGLDDNNEQVASVTPENLDGDTGAVQTDNDALPVGPLSGTNEGPQTVQDAEVAYVASGIWQLSPDQSPTPGFETSDDIYVASIDRVVNSFDAVALPSVSLSDHETAPRISNFPIAPGLSFDFDERGFVKATPNGAITPEGVRVVSGRPNITIPDRPEETLREAVVASANLPNTRPKARPTDFSDRIERSTLSGRTLAELGKLRPKARPQSVQDIAANEDGTDANTPDQNIEGATKLAVLASLKPASRPKNFQDTVAAAVATSVSTGAAQSTVPRTATTAPSIPTRASVARSATQRNAIRLNAVSLLGVTGKSNAYRALVRLPSGRIKTVEVGDRLDGGKVASIGSGSLSYVKSGRNVVLKMPDEG